MVRTRFAPSPTGYLHIGGVRTALYSYAMAKRHNGKFLLRIEDTDQNRYVADSVQEIYDMLKAYNIEPDESDQHGGDFGPYTQSQRLDLYKKYADELIAKGAAYKCFLTPEEATSIKEANRASNAPFRSPHRDLSPEEVSKMESEGKSYVVRFKVPADRKIDFQDGVQGEMHFDTNFVDDQVLLKSDGFPTYHLAMLVDDHLMEISHVFRAFEWIPSTPLHVLLYEAMGWEMPQICHLSTILDPDGGKLSKRKGATSAREFLQEGYLPEAVLNFLMLLGWSSPEKREFGEAEREIYSLTEFVNLFAIEDLNKSNPVFNRDKLLWFNKQYLANSNNRELGGKLMQWLEHYAVDKSLLPQIKADAQAGKLEAKLELVKTRANTLVDLLESMKFFYVAPQNVDWSIKQLNNVQDRIQDLRFKIQDLIGKLPEDAAQWQHETWEAGMRAIAEEFQVKAGDVFMVLRVAVVGGPFSPPLFESLQILGKTEVLNRLA
jgi:glutamyl-tRNA synthetase